MRKISFSNLYAWVIAAMLLTIIACGSGSGNGTDTDSTKNAASNTNNGPKHAMATLVGTKPDTAVTGTVDFTVEAGKVKMDIKISVPTKANQVVAVHIHENGACGDMGKAAGGHWNPSHQSHGKWGSASFHSGDIGNISLDANGNGTLQLETDLWSIGGDDTKNILNHSIVVHGGADDYTSQPSGNSGERIGCGVIRQVNK